VTPARAGAAGAVLLALAAGAVDAVSFIVLHHTFTANMTGNSTQLGISGGRADAKALVPLAVAVATFVGSIALATAGIEVATRRRLRAAIAPVLVLEAALLAVFMVDGHRLLRDNTVPDHTGGFYLLLVVAVVAMGVQTASLTKALGTTVRTTYVSGMLTYLGQEAVSLFVPEDGKPSYLRDEVGLPGRHGSAVRLGLRLSVWAAFVGGAAWGGYGERRWTTWALAVPVGAVLTAALLDLRRG
jgi:uncharacterized membrane protein YoaK (UPF0700 family)